MLYPPVLIGPAGAGKTKIGRELSQILNSELIIGDDAFVSRNGSIDDFILSNGKQAFRAAEADLIKDVCSDYAGSLVVFSLGSGAVANNDNPAAIQRNLRNLREFGVLFYITPNADVVKSAWVLTKRLRAEESSHFRSSPDAYGAREPINFQRLLGQLAFRHPLYTAAADETLYNTYRTPHRVAVVIHGMLLRKYSYPDSRASGVPARL